MGIQWRTIQSRRVLFHKEKGWPMCGIYSMGNGVSTGVFHLWVLFYEARGITRISWVLFYGVGIVQEMLFYVLFFNGWLITCDTSFAHN